MLSQKIQKYIAILLLCVEVLFFTTSDGYGRIVRNSLDDLPYGNIEGATEEYIRPSSETLTEPNSSLISEELKLPFQDGGIGMFSNALIEKKTTINGIIQSTIVTSELLENTLIRNAEQLSLNMENFGISEARNEELEKARAQFRIQEGGSLKEVIGFEYGIPGEHLIFSKPVRLEINTPTLPNGKGVHLLVRHSTDINYNTSGLSLYPDTQCNTDGTATKPSETGRVQDGKVVFYTCGASSFALGYAPIIDLPNNTVFTTSSSSSGYLIVGGQFTTVGGVTRTRVARLSSSGGLDTNFIDPVVNNIVYASAIQSDGKVLIGGAFTGVAGTTRNYLARLNSDGTLDTTFNANITLVAGNQVRSILIQPDGKILIGGTFATVGGVARNRIARLNSDGTLDATFNANSNNTIYTLALQSDGKVLIGGTFTTMGGVTRNRLARVSATGGLDATFNPNVNNTIWDLKIDASGNIVIGGAFTTIGAVAVTRNRLARISSTGGLDMTFDPNVNNIVQAVTIEPSGNIIFGGSFTTVTAALTVRNRIARVSATGGLDMSFDPNAGSTVYAFSQRSDGTIAIGGAFTTIFTVANTYLSYINPTNAILDSRYNLYTNNIIWTTAPYPSDTKVIVGGQFTTVGGVTRTRVARLSSSGALDTTFIDPVVNNIVYASAIQSNGKVLIGGAFTGVAGTTRNYLARLNSDGTLDTTFNANITLVAGNQVRSILIQPDGKILIGGTFATVGGVARNRIARLNSDGTLDATFNANSNNTIYTLALQSDGKVLIGGTFTTMGGVTRNRLARVSATGGLDATFNPNVNNTIWDLKIDASGNIVIGGAFTTIGAVAVTRNRLARISSTGGLDATFNPNVNNIVQAVTIEPSGNIIFGGSFTTVTAALTVRNRIARVSATGGLDMSFDPNANGIVYSLTQDFEKNLLVGGAFTTLGTKATRYFSWIGLLSPDITAPVISSISLASGTLLPIGNFSITGSYSDIGSGILPSGVNLTLEKWGSGTWGGNILSTYLSGSASINTTTGIWTFRNTPFGKYRYTLTVNDIQGNSSSITREFYIDAIEWTINQPSINIGNLTPGIQKTSVPNEITLTVKTVGVPFSLSMSGTSLSSSGTVIVHWTGSEGYGYEQYASGYTNSLSSLSGGVTLISQSGNINPNGDKNTYTYSIQYGGLVNTNILAGDYTGTLGFTLNMNY